MESGFLLLLPMNGEDGEDLGLPPRTSIISTERLTFPQSHCTWEMWGDGCQVFFPPKNWSLFLFLPGTAVGRARQALSKHRAAVPSAQEDVWGVTVTVRSL